MKQFANFMGQEVLNLAVGYLAGLIASNLVSRYFVKKGLVNLWGLTAFKRDALKKDDYEWLMFASSYLLGLIVMILVQYLMRQLRGQKTVQVD
ncbi:MAG: hypothetical protein AAFU60_04590 [Bacteroidota bacterium]